MIPLSNEETEKGWKIRRGARGEGTDSEGKVMQGKLRERFGILVDPLIAGKSRCKHGAGCGEECGCTVTT